MVVVLLSLVLITAGILWWGFFVTGGVPEGPPPPARRVEVDISILSNPLLQELANPREPVTIPSDLGRDNPLLPLP
ncbi:MAG: hypothetical protein Q8P12_03230 [bacterium]|nr:hypothetical protein [bacterium]